MTRTFWHTKTFDKQWATLGCTDEELSEVQRIICENPQAGAVIRGSGGVRKIRTALEGRGKRGGARIIYGDFPVHGITYLFAVYPKNEKENISEDERHAYKTIMEQIDKAWRNRK
jgi:hypothetical protein